MAEEEYWLGLLRLFLKSLKTKHHGSYLVWPLKIQILTEGSFPKDASSFCRNASSRNTVVSDVGSSTDQAHKLHTGRRTSSTLPSALELGVARAAGCKGEAKMPRGTTITHAKSCILLGKGESDFTLYLPFPTSPALNGQMWLCKKLITDGG